MIDELNKMIMIMMRDITAWWTGQSIHLQRCWKPRSCDGRITWLDVITMVIMIMVRCNGDGDDHDGEDCDDSHYQIDVTTR